MDKTLYKTLLVTCLITTLIALSYAFMDRPIAEAAHTLKHTAWHALANTISQAANHLFYNVMIVIGLIYGTYHSLKNGSSEHSKHILYFCLSIAAAMLIGDVFKEICGRARPLLFFTKGIYGFFPLAGDYLHYSFPSGHTLRIFSSMVALGLILPRLRSPALLLAMLVGISRVLALKHYPSDVLFGAFIGSMAAIWGWKILYPYGQRIS